MGRTTDELSEIRAEHQLIREYFGIVRQSWLRRRTSFAQKSQTFHDFARPDLMLERLDASVAANNALLRRSIPDANRLGIDDRDLDAAGLRADAFERWSSAAKAIQADKQLDADGARRALAALSERHLRQFEGAVNAHRQRALGVTRYIWRSRDDDKVRREHAAYDDQVFAWDDPPPGGHPGEAPNCRCVAEPFVGADRELITRDEWDYPLDALVEPEPASSSSRYPYLTWVGGRGGRRMRNPSLRIGDRRVRLSNAQALELDIVNARRRVSFREARAIDPNWRPAPSLTRPTVDGLIARMRSEAFEAEAFASRRRAGRQAPRDPMGLFFRPDGRPVGRRGSRDEIQELPRRDFLELLAPIEPSFIEITPPRGYSGRSFRAPSGAEIGVRRSARYGTTVDIHRDPTGRFGDVVKFHWRR